ncbi:MAG TPA: hypothetical protein VLC53_13940, partial [Myxococcota bacterium]|nr:hypothetical protein [Myxococcota bacterium]
MSRTIAVLAAALVPWAAAAGFPRAVTLPDLPVLHGEVEVKPYAQEEFIERGKVQVIGGKLWLGYLEYRDKWGEDRRDALAGIINEMEKGGWEVLLRDEPRVPPLATLRRREDDGGQLWARVEIFDQARVAVLEPGPP